MKAKRSIYASSNAFKKLFVRLGEKIFSTIYSNVYTYFTLKTKMPNYLDFGDYVMLPKHLKCKHHSYLLALLTTFIFISGKRILFLSFSAEKYNPLLGNPLTNFFFLYKIKSLDN